MALQRLHAQVLACSRTEADFVMHACMKEMRAWGYKLLTQAAPAAGRAAQPVGRPAEGGGQRQGGGPQGAACAASTKAEGACAIIKPTARSVPLTLSTCTTVSVRCGLHLASHCLHNQQHRREAAENSVSCIRDPSTSSRQHADPVSGTRGFR